MKKAFIFLAFLLVANTLIYAQMSNGLVGYWKLDEASGSVLDATGSNTGTNSGATPNQAGKINTAYSFNGTNSGIIVNNTAFNFGTATDFSFSAWVKTTYGSDQFIIAKYNTGYTPGIMLGTDQNKPYACIRDGVGSGANEIVIVSGTTNINDNNWHFVVATFDRDGYLRLFLDGSEQASASISSLAETVNNSNNFCIGFRDYASLPYVFNGSIDEAGVWNRVLSSTEILTLYNGGAGLTYPFTSTNYTLTTTPSPTAGGNITLSPAGGTYTFGTSVTATANTNSGYTFSGWSGAATGTTNPVSITMDANKSLTATFTTATTYSLTITTPTNGTITASPAGPNYASGTTVSLTANPSSGYQLSAWGESLSGTTNPATLTMNANKTVSATFVPVSGGSDNLGNHTATQNLKLGSFWLSSDGGSEGIRVDANGNIGIGIAPLTSTLLTVNGKILAKEVEVVSSITSDYVFEPEYILMPLTELEIYVRKNKHLPNIPSAITFSKEGQNLAKVDDMLLRKVEELTLYILEQNKMMEQLNSCILKQSEQIEALQSEIKSLKNNKTN